LENSVKDSGYPVLQGNNQYHGFFTTLRMHKRRLLQDKQRQSSLIIQNVLVVVLFINTIRYTDRPGHGMMINIYVDNKTSRKSIPYTDVEINFISLRKMKFITEQTPTMPTSMLASSNKI
jgi:hypothetical protein